MKHSLPPIVDSGVLPLSHFPTRMQCFVFRNWGLLEPSVLSRVLGCDTETVRALAVEMGLPAEPEVDPAWLTKGYITVIRANWHLCSYEQIAELLGWTTEKLAFILREDDFLSVKLGNAKPALPPLAYVPLTEEQHAETARIRHVVEEASALLPEHPAKPFDFAPLFRSAVRKSIPAKADAPRFEERIVYSYCALYGDTFSDRSLLDASFPDELLDAYRSLGVTGVWTQAVLYTLTPYPFDKALSEGWERRLDGMRYLVGKLKKYGLKLFLYLNEPRAMPLAFYDAYPELKGHEDGRGYACLCVSTPEVQKYLYDASNLLCREVPGLGGYLTITASENLTNCYSHSVPSTCTCPRCRNRQPAEVIGDVNRLLYEGGAAANPDIRLLAWNWGWNGRQPDMTHAVMDYTPKGVTAMCVSEEGVKKNIGGVETSVIDYSISVEGPGDYALDTWSYAHKTGHKAFVKLQLGCTWEMAAVPCVPAFEKIYRHLSGIVKKGNVDGAMLGWTLGGFPSPTLRLAQGFYGQEETLPTLTELYESMFPGGDIPALADAFHLLSEAFDAYPFHISVAYNAPQLYGSSNLLYPEKTGYSASMVGNPYDDLRGWRAIFPEDVFISQLKKLSDGWDAGTAALEAAASGSEDDTLCALVRWTKVCACHFRSMYNQSRFVQTRDRDGVLDREIIKSEADLARTMLRLSAQDPAVGYESTNHYFFTKNTLLEKLVNCDYLLQ